MKKCTICKKEKDVDDFNKNKNGKYGVDSYCRECSKIRDKERYKENYEKVKDSKNKKNREWVDNKRKYILEYLKEHPCVDCGEKDPIVLEFDHVKGIKIDTVCRMVSKNSLETIKEEISKCEVRCANCHRRKTAKDFNYFNRILK